MNSICLYICMTIIIICTLLMIASFIYREYWERKLKKEMQKMREENIIRETIGGKNEQDHM